MKPKEILQELRRLVDLKEIEVTPLLPDSGFKTSYDPITTYLDQLQKGSKPETAAEGLFRPLAEIFLNAPALPQVGLGSGFVDFKLDAKEESSIVIELKPLFILNSAELLKSHRLESTGHRGQVEKYLQHSEYLVLTDLRDAYLYSARDLWQPLKPFAKLSFADLLERTLAKQSLLDVIRDEEDDGHVLLAFTNARDHINAAQAHERLNACNHDSVDVRTPSWHRHDLRRGWETLQKGLPVF